MGYESRVIIVKRSEFKSITGKTVINGEEIANMKMSKMEGSFSNLFKREGKEIDFGLYIYDGDEETTMDYYGEHCKMIELSTLIDYMQKQINNGDNYRRLKPLLGLLQGFDPQQWECDTPTLKQHLYAVHFGY